ncbi:hypothetical protein Sjap_016677 [Stephania japonica]|uniref:non-specific serine/threonine protein kinase n=1 Tax=Stephania japonica TaxID=461633 RepID=A0AAP0NU23_9MAGN
MAILGFFAVLSSLFFASSDAFPSNDVTDAMSLLEFKRFVSAVRQSSLLSDWIPESHHCNWSGVTCDGLSGRVVSLNITGSLVSRIAGTLSPAVGNLTELRVLALPRNAFFGEIPVEIEKLRMLKVLDLRENNFSGEIPNQISNLSSLRFLNLSCNSLAGSLPKKLIGFGVIREIDLSYNQLNSRIRIDPMSRCESLLHLRLSGNFLVENIPPEIGNCSSLRSILLDRNVLEGEIPAEIGRISELRVLDVSKNSLTERIPRELAECRKLSVIVLTNLVDGQSDSDDSLGESNSIEFNAFSGGIPPELLLLPSLEVFWAPRANLGGPLPNKWKGSSCNLQVLNLAQNYMNGSVPESIGPCRNLSFLDLSSNMLTGALPSQLQVPCMVYFNISHNLLTDSLPVFEKSSCSKSMLPSNEDGSDEHSIFRLSGSEINIPFGEVPGRGLVIFHDFSRNNFTGSLPLFSIGNGFLPTTPKPSYHLLLNSNLFNGSLPGELFSNCAGLQSFAVNLSSNRMSGGISQGLLFNCLQLTSFKASYNHFSGPIPPEIGLSQMLQCLDLRGNSLNGSLPEQVEKLKNLKQVLLGGNSLAGDIPSQLGHLPSLSVLDLSRNALTGSIPTSLGNATKLEVVLLDHNKLLGEIPSSFSSLSFLSKLDVSFNDLSGRIPRLQHFITCDQFKGNNFLPPCPEPNPYSPTILPIPLAVDKSDNRKTKLKLVVIATVVSASVIFLVLLAMVLLLVLGRRKLCRVASLRRKVVVTFTEVPKELNYDNVVKATGNFSIRHLIGTGGFGATYKTELVPGYIIAVKRLSIGRFQGVQQFDAEIRTLGRIRHKNLVTLIGYYTGEAEMFLIYNFLSGGNLETFIHDSSGNNTKWPVIHKIALDIAQALAYLHYTCIPRIVHRDIKPSNILLDEKLNAYLSDFGLARLLEVSETHATTDVAGTFGYVAPEYATTCRVTDKSDVYSFGIVLLELMSGKRSLDPSFSEYGNGFTIVAWAKLFIAEGHSSEFFSPELWEAGPRENLMGLLRLALDCTVELHSVRPSMRQVVDKLKALGIPES